MKRIQPYYYIVALAALFILAGILLFGFQIFSAPVSSGFTVEPQAQNREDALYDLWFISTTIYDISIDHNMTGILFSAGNNTVSLLDQERRLRWDKTFSSVPQQAKLSSCGQYILIGTAGGNLYFSTVDQQQEWESEGDPVELIALSPSATWIAVGRAPAGQEGDRLELYKKSGEKVWSIDTGPLRNLYLTSEYLEQGNIFYTSQLDGQPMITALDLDGNELWEMDNYALMAVTRHGSRLAAVRQGEIVVSDSLGYELWQGSLPFNIEKVMFNPYNYNRLLLYGSREGSGDNLYYYDLADGLLWSKRIADGSLFAFSADGQQIITSSWRHYKDDYTQMFLLDHYGNELNTWEVAMRIECLLVSGNQRFAVIGGEDGYIDLIDLESMLADAGNGNQVATVYKPVSTGAKSDETRIRLYFIGENGELVPVTRSISYTENPARAALEELIRGPARGSYLYRTIPDKDASIEVVFDEVSATLILELTPELAAMNGDTQARSAFMSLISTASAFNEVEEILLTLDGEPLEVFGRDLSIEQPVTPISLAQPFYMPVQSGERYYLTVSDAKAPTGDERDIEDIIEKTLAGCRELDFVPNDLELAYVSVTPEQVQIMLSASFAEIFPETVDEEAHQKAALILDALFLTVFENSRPQRVVISAQAQNWLPPEGYPPLSRFFRQPYFINPE